MNFVSEHRLRNNPAERRRLACWVADFVQRAQLPATVGGAIDLALEECVTNIFSYAWKDEREHWATIRFAASDSEARIEIEDDGREFNPLAAPPVDVTQSLEARPVGGLGVHMVRQLMDAVEYRRENGRNILTLIKRIAGSG